MRRQGWTALVVLAGACGDGGTGPADRLTGDWTYDVRNLNSNGVSCNASGTVLHIRQGSTEFSGTYVGGGWICTHSGGADTFPIGSGTVVNGRLSGDTVRFYLDSDDWYSVGPLNGDSMGGTANARFPGTAMVFPASWSSKRM